MSTRVTIFLAHRKRVPFHLPVGRLDDALQKQDTTLAPPKGLKTKEKDLSWPTRKS